MKQIEIDVNSWHFKLIKYCDYYAYSITDICEYRWALIKSLFWCFLMVVVVFGTASFVVYGFTNTLAWYLAMIVSRTFIHADPIAVIVSTLMILTVIILTIYGSFKGLGKIIDSRDNTVKVMYHSWKNKWCSKVVFKD